MLVASRISAAFDDDQAIREILIEAGVKNIDDFRAYYYRYNDPHKQNDSPINEFKRRRDASNRFVANMSMPGRAWTSLEEHWVCKLPLPNPMCAIARVEGPRSRNENENMAAGMVAMVMEAGVC